MTNELRDVQRIGPPGPEIVEIVYQRCHVCGGDGYVEMHLTRDGIGVIRDCAYCSGTGQIAVEVQ